MNIIVVDVIISIATFITTLIIIISMTIPYLCEGLCIIVKHEEQRTHDRRVLVSILLDSGLQSQGFGVSRDGCSPWCSSSEW